MAIPSINPYRIPPEASWPSSRAPWQLEAGRAALLVHDLQAYFLAPFAREQAPLAEMLPHVRQLQRACERANVPVIFSEQPGEQSREERGLLWDVWGPGIVERPELERLELTPGPCDVRLRKRRYSAFHDTELASLLHARGCDQLWITGVYAHIGCLATANDAFMRGFKPFMVADALADFSAEDHAVALRQVARTAGVLVSTRSVLQALALATVRGVLAELLRTPAEAIPLDDDLADHGLDSVRGMELLSRLLPADHDYDYSTLLEARSLRTLAALLDLGDLEQDCPTRG
jgi:bifunctional isochorismate lyase / aryl carrier protein